VPPVRTRTWFHTGARLLGANDVDEYYRGLSDAQPWARPLADTVLPDGMTVLGTSSDHLVLDVGDHAVSVGDEVALGLDYSALVRAMTSPFITKVPAGA